MDLREGLSSLFERLVFDHFQTRQERVGIVRVVVMALVVHALTLPFGPTAPFGATAGSPSSQRWCSLRR